MADEKKQTQEQKLEDRLLEILYKKFGDQRWHERLALNVRADTLSWIVRLALWGLAARRKEMNMGDAGDMMSVASWLSDLDGLIEQIATAPVVKESRAKPKKK